MTQIFHVGIDGGGSKTLLRLASENGTPLAETGGGPANIATDPEQAWNSVEQALRKALHLAGVSGSGHLTVLACAGLAGAEIPEAREKFLALSHGFTRLTLYSDAQTSCIGAHSGQDGAILAVGTGSVGFACLGGQTRRTGGWGFPHDDTGSGAWIGMRAAGIMLRAEDGRLPHSALSRAVAAWIREQGSASVTAWPAGLTAAQAASLTPLVFREAENSCPVAETLLCEAAEEIALLGRSLLQGPFSTLPLCLCGGLGERLKHRSVWLESHCIPASGTALDGAMHLVMRSTVLNA